MGAVIGGASLPKNSSPRTGGHSPADARFAHPPRGGGRRPPCAARARATPVSTARSGRLRAWSRAGAGGASCLEVVARRPVAQARRNEGRGGRASSSLTRRAQEGRRGGGRAPRAARLEAGNRAPRLVGIEPRPAGSATGARRGLEGRPRLARGASWSGLKPREGLIGASIARAASWLQGHDRGPAWGRGAGLANACGSAGKAAASGRQGSPRGQGTEGQLRARRGVREWGGSPMGPRRGPRCGGSVPFWEPVERPAWKQASRFQGPLIGQSGVRNRS